MSATEFVAWYNSHPDYVHLKPNLDVEGVVVVGVGNVAMDESVMALAVGPNRFPGRSDYERVGAELALARDRLERAGYLADPVEYHREPPALRLPATSDRRSRRSAAPPRGSRCAGGRPRGPSFAPSVG